VCHVEAVGDTGRQDESRRGGDEEGEGEEHGAFWIS
jgi:hypothetical protein